ncbi:hypothetical protein CDL12_19638 [Handroanthus impetiginosus]|uniref:Uncharacterized protein n=1 Tax=Handroanthus impetiginosus TaxID=429701 RepID=A0A2G9GRF5_9LAMI|nr:hypothetical protein CDL12_19638 [Handroanthus impetiginosus]
MVKAVITHKLFFIGFLLMYGLNLSNQRSLPRYDRRPRSGQPSPPSPSYSRPNHQGTPSSSYNVPIHD